jgi:DUF1009 family protein
MTQSQNPRYAVIAGNGRFPFLVLEGAREQGVDPVVIAIQEEAWPELAQKAQSIHWLSLGEIAKLMDVLGREQINKVILAGQVKHVQLFRPIKADQMMSNALATLPCRNTDALIGAFVGMLEEQGIEVLDSTTFLKPLLAGVGLLTRREPELSERADVEYGREIAKKIAGLDIGQTVVVADRACVAVEAMEGTDETIERAARLSNGRRLVVVKVSKPDQDMRFDVPVVGVKTIEVMDRANARVLAVDAGKTLLFERDLLLSKANDCGITIVGMED